MEGIGIGKCRFVVTINISGEMASVSIQISQKFSIDWLSAFQIKKHSIHTAQTFARFYLFDCGQ